MPLPPIFNPPDWKTAREIVVLSGRIDAFDRESTCGHNNTSLTVDRLVRCDDCGHVFEAPC